MLVRHQTIAGGIIAALAFASLPAIAGQQRSLRQIADQCGNRAAFRIFLQRAPRALKTRNHVEAEQLVRDTRGFTSVPKRQQTHFASFRRQLRSLACQAALKRAQQALAEGDKERAWENATVIVKAQNNHLYIEKQYGNCVYTTSNPERDFTCQDIYEPSAADVAEAERILSEAAHQPVHPIGLDGSPNAKRARVKLGSPSSRAHPLESKIEEILTAMRGNNAVLLSWVSSRAVPQGVKIGNKTIEHTQHGIVTDQQQEWIGTYERLPAGGDTGLLQRMIVFLNAGN